MPFVQVLAVCRRAGLVGLGHVAVDGTKLRANASKHKAMSYARMGPAEADLAAEVEGWLAQAEGVDAEEDAALGADRRGDEMPAWMRDKQRRLERIRAAKAELEAEARAAEAAKPDPGKQGGRLAAPAPRAQAEAPAWRAEAHRTAQLHRSGEPDHEGP